MQLCNFATMFAENLTFWNVRKTEFPDTFIYALQRQKNYSPVRKILRSS